MRRGAPKGGGFLIGWAGQGEAYCLLGAGCRGGSCGRGGGDGLEGDGCREGGGSRAGITASSKGKTRPVEFTFSPSAIVLV
jgi:hypothetical protein